MPGIENINIALSFNPLFIVAGILLLGIFTLFIYKYTIPQVSIFFKSILIALRVLALILILIIIFEPIITANYEETEEPKTYLFIDNSRSIVNKDSLKRANEIKQIISEIGSSVNNDLKFYSFSKQIDSLKEDKVEQINFSGGLTNLSSIINFLNKKDENIASAIVISDGIITDGSNPVYEAEKLAFPMFVIGVGDSVAGNDISINKVLYNEYIYAEKSTVISANILNTGFEGKTISVRLLEDNNLIEQKNVELNNSGINKVEFNYTPPTSGDKRLRIETSRVTGEFNFENNRNIFFINCN